MNGSSQALLIRNARFMDRAGPADILIEAGRIAAIGPGLAAPPAARMIDARDRLVTPGLVNAHWHSPMQLSPGTSDRMNHKVFMWENQVDTANRSPEEIYLSAVIGCLQMLKSGTTSVIDHFPEQGFGLDDVATVVKAYADCGMRAVVALRIFDGEYSDIVPPPERMTDELREALKSGNTLAPRPAQESLDLVRAAIEKFDRTAGRIRVFPAPSNPVRCSDALLVACQDMAESLDTGVHCHLLETRTQAELAARAYGRIDGRAHGSDRRVQRAMELCPLQLGLGARDRHHGPARRGRGVQPGIQSQDRLRHPADPKTAGRRRAVRGRHRRCEHQRQSDPAGRDAARRHPASRRRAGPAALGDGRRRDRDGDHRRRQGDA